MNWLFELLKKLIELITIGKPVVISPPIIELPPTRIISYNFADVSHWEKVNLDLYQPTVLVCKATEGIKFVDDTFKNLQLECKKKGIKFGAYHFFRCDQSPIAQAKHFIQTVIEFDLNPVLDIETLDGVDAKTCRDLIQDWLDYVELNTDKTPIIYSSYSFLVELSLPERFSKYPLWLARYTKVVPVAPYPWKSWAIWQYSDKAPFKGIGECDGNLYNEKSNLI